MGGGEDAIGWWPEAVKTDIKDYDKDSKMVNVSMATPQSIDELFKKIETKDTNPKDVIAGTKIALDVMPDTIAIAGAAAFYEGMLKYGRYNWRVAGARASVYKSAYDRHFKCWWNGEDIDPDSGLPHLWKALACLSILIDASVCGVLTDDRPPSAPVSKMMQDLLSKVEELKLKHKDKKPYQYTIKDSLSK